MLDVLSGGVNHASMSSNGPVGLDVVIFGGGAAGLWLLDELLRREYRAVLLEAGHLGSGQTIGSQGIIHGGLKYTLGGLFTRSAAAIREMPIIWRQCLAGESKPNLKRTRLRAPYCHIWRTSSLTSRVAMLGARAGLRVAPVPLDRDQRPGALRDCPGVVARLEEQVIEPDSFLTTLADRLRPHLLRIDVRNGLEFETDGPGAIRLIRLLNPETGEPMDLAPVRVILAAGAGNELLRGMIGLTRPAMQRRPLHMVLVRGGLPVLNGHCVDGAATRLTITTTQDHAGRSVWQVGGQVAEDGVALEPPALIAHARRELLAALPGLDLTGAEWATYRVDRAEHHSRGGFRPNDAYAKLEGTTITAWPTKLALVPRLAERVLTMLDQPRDLPEGQDDIQGWPQPSVALPPWETELSWYDESSARRDSN